jgi:energy-coupling factor transport system ATP-binding protein
VIQLENASFTYGNNDTVSGQNNRFNGVCPINLCIKKGEFIVLTGGSGCGKTTVTRFINGLIPNYYEGKKQGHIKLNAQSIDNMTIADTAKVVGSVFQNPRSQFFNVDTTSELAFAAENQGIEVMKIQQRITKVSNDFQLQALLGRSIFELSGGEKQKIACASVAVANPEIIVLDEPSSNLDTQAIEDLTKVLKHWKAQGKTIVIA